VSVSFQTEKACINGVINFYKNMSRIKEWNILARQVGIYYGDLEIARRRTSLQSRIVAAEMLLGRRPIPNELQVTCEAIRRYDVWEGIDPRLFDRLDRRVVYRPLASDLSAWNLTENDVSLAGSQPGLSSDSAVFICSETSNKYDVFFHDKVPSGPYKGRFTIGGEPTDNMVKVSALDKAKKEAIITSSKYLSRRFHPYEFADHIMEILAFEASEEAEKDEPGYSGHLYRAKPLGRADQVVAVGSGPEGEVRLQRYINNMWVIPLGPDDQLISPEAGREWFHIEATEELPARINRSEGWLLTPVAECAIQLLELRKRRFSFE